MTVAPGTAARATSAAVGTVVHGASAGERGIHRNPQAPKLGGGEPFRERQCHGVVVDGRRDHLRYGVARVHRAPPTAVSM